MSVRHRLRCDEGHAYREDARRRVGVPIADGLSLAFALRWDLANALTQRIDIALLTDHALASLQSVSCTSERSKSVSCTWIVAPAAPKSTLRMSAISTVAAASDCVRDELHAVGTSRFDRREDRGGDAGPERPGTG